MKFNRRVYIVATFFMALFLITTNVYAAKLISSAGDGGSIDPLGTMTVNRNDTIVYTLTPDANFRAESFYRSGSAPKNDLEILDVAPPVCTEDAVTHVVTCTLTDFIDNFNFDATFAPIPVIAGFMTDQPSGSEAGVTVHFTDTSENGPTVWAWDFGDGATSTEQNPSHIFAVGTYNVTLMATNVVTNTSDTYTLTYTAIQPTIDYHASAGENGSISPAGDVQVDEGSTTTFTITPAPLYRVANVFVDGSSICDDVPDVTCEEITAVTFAENDKADHSISASFEPIPVVASFSGPNVEITTDDQVQFTDTSTPQSNLSFWNWYIRTEPGTELELISEEQNPVLIFTEAGDYSVILEVGNTATSETYEAPYTVTSNYLSSPVMHESNSKGYSSLQIAYDAITTSETIRMKASVPIEGNLFFNHNVIVILKGGYDDAFGNNDNGFSKVNGNVTVSDGTVIVSKVIVGQTL